MVTPDCFIPVLTWVEEFAPELLARLLRSCLHGCLLFILVFLFCRFAPRLPAPVRFWLWWLVCLKFLVTLCAPGIVTVPLPHRTVTVLPAPLTAVLPTAPAPTKTIRARPISGYNDSIPQSLPTPPLISPSPTLPPARTPRESLLLALAVLYVGGVVAAFLRMILATLGLRQRIRRAIPVQAPAIQGLLVNLQRSMGFRFLPALRHAPDIATPQVVGIAPPVVLLPSSLLDSEDPETVRLALAHELAHLRRGDLWWNLIPCLARILFGFLPAVPFAIRELEQAREEACDRAALCATESSPLRYGQLLVSLTDRPPSLSPTAAINLSPSGFRSLKRRLLALQSPAVPLSAAQRAQVSSLLSATIVGTVPLQFIAPPLADSLTLTDFLPSTPVIQPRYSIVPLPALGDAYSDAFDINEHGLIVGAAHSGLRNDGHAFRASSTAERWEDLSADSHYRRSVAFAVNNYGVTAAAAFHQTSKPQAFFYDGKRHYIGTLPGFGYSRAVAINDSGVVVANALKSRRWFGVVPARAFAWQPGTFRDLGTLGGLYSTATAINNIGTIVGKADLPQLPGTRWRTHAFLWTAEGGMRDLGTLPGGSNSRANDINNAGDIVGYSETGIGFPSAFVIPTNGTMRPLPVPAGFARSEAHRISDTGNIVGTAISADGTQRTGLLWQRLPGGEFRVIDLNTCLPAASGWRLEVARSINRDGWIVGQGSYNGKPKAFVLRPE